MEEPGTLQSRDHDHHDLVDGKIGSQAVATVLTDCRGVVGGHAERQGREDQRLQH